MHYYLRRRCTRRGRWTVGALLRCGPDRDRQVGAAGRLICENLIRRQATPPDEPRRGGEEQRRTGKVGRKKYIILSSSGCPMLESQAGWWCKGEEHLSEVSCRPEGISGRWSVRQEAPEHPELLRLLPPPRRIILLDKHPFLTSCDTHSPPVIPIASTWARGS
ncbi:hypothetical protein E2C01_034335 [Portunus trituberculatus]|uniref:Uncharacterized protein n=1 Tax=Portunus trituberculatus TaxID=210409 RepID=A0A5B7F6Q3_PORTR|nr:hypothetical protein [Portunus trituberculatus]